MVQPYWWPAGGFPYNQIAAFFCAGGRDAETKKPGAREARPGLG
jgi:hypothetical protein